MIALWHNGKEWSDAHVAFVDFDESLTADVEAVLRLVDPGGRLLGIAREIEWREPNEHVALYAYVAEHCDSAYGLDEHPERITPISTDTLRALVVYLVGKGCIYERSDLEPLAEALRTRDAAER